MQSENNLYMGRICKQYLYKLWREHFAHHTEEEWGWSDGDTTASSVQPAGPLPCGWVLRVQGRKNNFVYSFEFLAEGPVIKDRLPEKTKEMFINM